METPLDKLKKMTAWDVAPLVSEAELEELLDAAATADNAGLGPNDAGWQPTYDLNSAAAATWLLKAGRASATVEVDPPGSGLYTSKVFENCRAMAMLYTAKMAGSVSLARYAV